MSRFASKFRFFILIVLWVVAFYPVYPALIREWLDNPNNSHCILVPVISLFFVWKEKKNLRLAGISNFNWGAVILILSMALYIASYAGSISFIPRAMIVFSLIGMVMFTLGKAVFKLLVFPLFFLIFIVPVPYSIVSIVSFPLQLFATNMSSFIIQTLSIPVYQEGNMLYFVQTQLEVAEACSGIRSLLSLTMLSVLFAHLSDKGWVMRVILLVSAIPLALFANIVRVTGTGILAHFFGDKIARGFLHEFSGLAVFAFGFILLFLEALLLNRINWNAQPICRDKQKEKHIVTIRKKSI